MKSLRNCDDFRWKRGREITLRMDDGTSEYAIERSGPAVGERLLLLRCGWGTRCGKGHLRTGSVMAYTGLYKSAAVWQCKTVFGGSYGNFPQGAEVRFDLYLYSATA